MSDPIRPIQGQGASPLSFLQGLGSIANWGAAPQQVIPMQGMGESFNLSPEMQEEEGAHGVQNDQQLKMMRAMMLMQEIENLKQQQQQQLQQGDQQGAAQTQTQIDQKQQELDELMGGQQANQGQNAGGDGGGNGDGGANAIPQGGGGEAPVQGADGGGGGHEGAGEAQEAGGHEKAGDGGVQGKADAGAAEAGGAQDVDTSNFQLDDKETAAFIDHYLEQKGSPAAGKGAGAMMVEAGKKYNVDPKALLSIAGQETQFGKKGIGVNGMLGVGAYDNNPRNAVTNSKFAGLQKQIEVGAKTFANLREKGGATAKSSMAQQFSAVNKAGWATDKNWHNGCMSVYNSVSKAAATEKAQTAKTAATTEAATGKTSATGSASTASSVSAGSESKSGSSSSAGNSGSSGSSSSSGKSGSSSGSSGGSDSKS